MAETVWVGIQERGFDDVAEAVFIERAWAEEWAAAVPGRFVDELPLYRGRAPGLPQTAARASRAKKLLPLMLLLALPSLALAQVRAPAGNTVFAMDVTAASQGESYQLEVDNVTTTVPAGTFTVGQWEFPPTPLGLGTHNVRARSCNLWDEFGAGLLCSPWTPTLQVESVTGSPTTPTNFSIKSVTVTLTP